VFARFCLRAAALGTADVAEMVLLSARGAHFASCWEALASYVGFVAAVATLPVLLGSVVWLVALVLVCAGRRCCCDLARVGFGDL
jgi:hypothetical protein